MYNFWLGEETNIASEESSNFEKTYESVAKAFSLIDLLLFHKEFNGESDIIREAIEFKGKYYNNLPPSSDKLFLTVKELADCFWLSELYEYEKDFKNSRIYLCAGLLKINKFNDYVLHSERYVI